ncbi:MAG: hypothetical protein FWG70_11530 [Oscillospiraceae bacterium]|nr:hypothetical protein [Oscillospiraceae bacterium]
MQAYEGYLENGRFTSLDMPTRMVGRRRVIMTVLNEPVQNEPAENKHAMSWKKFLNEIKECNEPLGEDFDRIMKERVSFKKVLDL